MNKHITVKRFLPIISIAFMLCLLTQVLPPPVFGEVIQEPVTKNGEIYGDVTIFAGNSGSILGDKITANGASYDIKLNGDTVGNFVFNKNNPYIEIIITESVAVNVTWNCASKYANCIFYDAGTYKIPQLLQDNGKAQNFNAIWIGDVATVNPTGSIVAYGTEAQSFASMLSTAIELNPRVRSIRTSMIVLSDVMVADLQSIATNVQNGAILITINLPENNGVVDAPTMRVGTTVEQCSLDTLTNIITSEEISQDTQEIVPPYWIAITKQTIPEVTDVYMTLNDDEQSSEGITQKALEAVVNTALQTTSIRSFMGSGQWVHVGTKNGFVEFGANNRNGYQVRHEIYQLDMWDLPTGKEYWKVDTWIDSWIGTYNKGSNSCGPFLQSREIEVSCDSNSQVYKYGPGTTVESGTATIDINFGVSAGGPSVNVGYSKSWPLYGARYDTTRGLKWINWLESFRGPDYAWFPWYDEPCVASYKSYPGSTVVVFETNVGNGFSTGLYDLFTLRYDTDIHISGIYTKWTQSTYYVDYWWNVGYWSMF
jgi:hypothetical protein